MAGGINAPLLQNAKEREQSRKLAFGLCRAAHALDEVKCKGVSAERRVSLERYAERRMLSNVVQIQRTAGGYFLRFNRLAIYTLTPKMLPA